MTTNVSPLPVWLSVFFTELPCECCAQLRISANNDPSLTVTVSHENSETFSISGNAEIKDLVVADGDSLLITAYNKDDEVIAGGLYEVDIALIGQLGAVLSPIYESRLLVDQTAQKIVDRAASRALKTISEVRTGALVASGMEVAR